VEGLLAREYSKDLQSMNGIGYKETIEYLEGKYDLETLEEYMKKATHHLAKKQRTRFRKYIAESKQMPKENVTYRVYSL
jgi:tRNA dimethylallyltransferase